MPARTAIAAVAAKRLGKDSDGGRGTTGQELPALQRQRDVSAGTACACVATAGAGAADAAHPALRTDAQRCVIARGRAEIGCGGGGYAYRATLPPGAARAADGAGPVLRFTACAAGAAHADDGRPHGVVEGATQGNVHGAAKAAGAAVDAILVQAGLPVSAITACAAGGLCGQRPPGGGVIRIEGPCAI